MTPELQTSFKKDLVSSSSFVATNATLIGDVHLSDESSVWFGAVVRGDAAPIYVGQQTNIQDLACLHADPGFPCKLGLRVTIGHAAVVHGATIEDETLIGIRAVVLNGARVGGQSIIGAGAVVVEGQVIPPRSLAIGVPARVVREITESDLARILQAAEHYVVASRAYRASNTA